MEIRDPKKWEKYCRETGADFINAIALGGPALVFAQKWADGMERAMAKGKSLEDVVEKVEEAICRRTPAHQGLTGTQVGQAREVLVAFWKYGPQLRRYFRKQLR